MRISVDTFASQIFKSGFVHGRFYMFRMWSCALISI
jgi:hypothetical protein